VDTDAATCCVRSISLAVGKLEGVDGCRPFCTPDGVGAVLAVFWSGPGYHGTITRVVSVNQAAPATPFIATSRACRSRPPSSARTTRTARSCPSAATPAHPAVPADAVTASASGLDPEISPAYARLQEARVAKTRGLTVAQVDVPVKPYENGRDLGFVGEPRVSVLQLNLALDKADPYHAR
jgi:K+-transporting ATPase ATPase C chain